MCYFLFNQCRYLIAASDPGQRGRNWLGRTLPPGIHQDLLASSFIEISGASIIFRSGFDGRSFPRFLNLREWSGCVRGGV